MLISNPAYDKYGSGRALYSTPVPIWDKTTGNVASFVTSFTFQVSNFKNFYPGSGFIFFLTPTDKANIPPTSYGANLGVVDDNNAYNQFVGVEFDLYTNILDPNMKHIGIDINSLISSKIVEWEWVSGSLTQVSVAYDFPSKTLSVLVTYDNRKIATLAQIIDLKTVLPNTIRLGLAGASITATAHDIYSWSISISELKTTTSSASDK